MKNKIKNIIVGCGFSGATLAQKIADVLKEEVLIIEKKDHIAGNSYDYRDNNGICIHKHGPHIFHTNNEDVWKFLGKFTLWNNYRHEVKAMIDGREIPLPFNFNSIEKLFDPVKAQRLEQKLESKYGSKNKIPVLELKKDDDEEIKDMAEFVYEKVFLNYTKKQWGVTPEELDPSVTRRVPVLLSRDDRYFHDKYQGIPVGGYSKLISNMIDDPLIKIELKADFKKAQSEYEYERLFYTGPIDEFFDYKHGRLPYKSLRFELEEHDKEHFQDNSVINYPGAEKFTRITEFKYFLNDISSKTVIAREYPFSCEDDDAERYYPVPMPENHRLYLKYKKEAQSLKNVIFLGRLGDYSYYNMDRAVERALEVFKKL